MDKFATVDGLAQMQAQQATDSVKQAKGLGDRSVKSEAEADKAAKGFEALLLQQMLKSMWETVEQSNFLGGDSNQAGIYRDMLNQAISDSVSEGRGIGVKQYLRKELLKHDKDASK